MSRKLALFMMVSLDGYFAGARQELDWHHVDAEFEEFAVAQLRSSDLLLFGRRTYELMRAFWPTDVAFQRSPATAELMQTTPKLVASRTISSADWKNCRLMRGPLASEIAALKAESGKDILLLGSNRLAVALLEAGLLDEARIMVAPVALGQGQSLFAGLARPFQAHLWATRQFRNGNLLLTYSLH